MGDLALIGAPIKAQLLAARPGHKANVEFAKKVRNLYQQKKLVKKYQVVKKEGVVFDSSAIQRILPHRYPMLLVDKIIDLEIDKKVKIPFPSLMPNHLEIQERCMHDSPRVF